jgi:hypothetical protein
MLPQQQQNQAAALMQQAAALQSMYPMPPPPNHPLLGVALPQQVRVPTTYYLPTVLLSNRAPRKFPEIPGA